MARLVKGYLEIDHASPPEAAARLATALSILINASLRGSRVAGQVLDNSLLSGIALDGRTVDRYGLYVATEGTPDAEEVVGEYRLTEHAVLRVLAMLESEAPADNRTPGRPKPYLEMPPDIPAWALTC